MPSNAHHFSAETYFATQPPPPTLDVDITAVREFVARQAAVGRRVVLVTVRRRTVSGVCQCLPVGRLSTDLRQICAW